MHEPISYKSVPRDPDIRRAWVGVTLRRRGTPVADLAKTHNVSPSALWRALYLPSERMEGILAEALGITPQALFPERYTVDGVRTAIRKTRSRRAS